MHMTLLPNDEDLDLIHTRQYETRVYQTSPDELLVRGVVSDMKPPGLYIVGDPDPLEVHQMQLEMRISFPEFMERRDSLRFNCVPVLQIDGVTVTQSNAMARFVGKKAGLYPDNDVQALYCDEVMDALEDMNHYIVPTFSLKGDELKEAREKLVAGWLTIYLLSCHVLICLRCLATVNILL